MQATIRDMTINVTFRGGNERVFKGFTGAVVEGGLTIDQQQYGGEDNPRIFQRKGPMTLQVDFQPDRKDWVDFVFAMRKKAEPNATRTVERVDVDAIYDFGEQGISKIIMPDVGVSDAGLSATDTGNMTSGVLFTCTNPRQML